MNEKNSNELKNYVFIVMGLIISLAGIIYIIVQYSKLLSDPLIEESESDEKAVESEIFLKRVRNRFKQVRDDEGVNPDYIDDGDFSIEISE